MGLIKKQSRVVQQDVKKRLSYVDPDTGKVKKINKKIITGEKRDVIKVDNYVSFDSNVFHYIFKFSFAIYTIIVFCVGVNQYGKITAFEDDRYTVSIGNYSCSTVEYDWFTHIKKLGKLRPVFNLTDEIDQVYTSKSYLEFLSYYYDNGYANYFSDTSGNKYWSLTNYGQQVLTSQQKDDFTNLKNYTINTNFFGIALNTIISQHVGYNSLNQCLAFDERNLSLSDWIRGEYNWATYVMGTLTYIPKVINYTIYDSVIIVDFLVNW